MKVFLVPNYRKNEAVESGLSLELWLGRQGYEVAWAADQRSGITATPDIEGSDLVISLGGDGTLVPVPVFDHEAVDRALGGDDLSVKDEVGDELYVAEGLRGRRTDVG